MTYTSEQIIEILKKRIQINREAVSKRSEETEKNIDEFDQGYARGFAHGWEDVLRGLIKQFTKDSNMPVTESKKMKRKVANVLKMLEKKAGK